ncbi:membrane protein involved in the export of O-antigen and teichoic acid [Owenweeksia hongkongensis DSM 17368]|uniref:Membrane protein involved in the export of O-antigen and teichoic acid n=1 Tax=Owenweeksia hongkongensis (strain DSM 17368 / CIP 108786 / JCM 12287 / NRRL B-23963 / UST20020801) TaxID=926562 RepID=G8R8C1_OWEHD|nr:oligosaccharide flippase family protein [Owenweeksia hongkongensis]AEV33514.1 membrane protein involved in the export of O-antigen and teichoic acid [Owenweeksia hongkongensis DSM 17368]
MSALKKLAGQTAIYGLSSILARFLNFFLTPLHTTVLTKEDYGINSDVYSLIAFLMVVLTFGMETTFFRFYQNRDKHLNPGTIFSHALFPVITFASFFLIMAVVFLPVIAPLLRYENHPEYVVYLAIIVVLDALTAVPFAKLRAENKAFRFVSLKMMQIILFVLLNYFFYWLCPIMVENNFATPLTDLVYHPELGVAYIFISNLIASGLVILLLAPQWTQVKFIFNWKLEKRYLAYAAPLVIAGLAGIANEMVDKQFLKYLLPKSIAFDEIGVYSANYKIATFMMMFIQAFRFAVEPFIFSQYKGESPRKTYAQILKFFTIFQVLIFVGLLGFIDIVKIFIDDKYWIGLPVVPVLLFANLLVGINFNLNFWYKLEDKTRYGAYITFFGLFFTVVLNLLLIPKMGIMGAAIATLVSYGAMTLFSFYLNQKHFKTPYETGRILIYLAVSLILGYVVFTQTREMYFVNTAIILVLAGFIALLEKSELKKLLKNG